MQVHVLVCVQCMCVSVYVCSDVYIYSVYVQKVMCIHIHILGQC